jgi:hypothetical protein
MNAEKKPEGEAKSPILFYCKDCEKIVDANKIGRKYVYKCGVCGTKNVAFGTDKSIKSFFRVKEEKDVKEEVVVEEKEVEGEKEDTPKDEPQKEEVEKK